MRTRALQSLRHIRCLEKSEMYLHREKALAKLVHSKPLFGRHEGHILHIHAEENHPFMEDVIVLQIVEQRTRNLVQPRRYKHRGARHAKRSFVRTLKEQIG